MWSALKNVLTGLKCVDHCVATSLRNFSSKTIPLALDWLHQELVTMMHDLNHTLVLVGVVFLGLKTVL